MKNFASQHWHKIDNYGFSISDLIDFLRLTRYNYEMAYNGKTCLQIKGCPMTAHFSPALAIIFMNGIEQKALDILNHEHDIKPTIYKRFIDDAVL